jgi:hypothetical protein
VTEPKRPFDVAVWAYWLARRNRLRRDLAALPRRVGCTVIGPPERPRVRFDDFSRSVELVEQGYQVAVDVLDGPAPPAEAPDGRRSVAPGG